MGCSRRDASALSAEFENEKSAGKGAFLLVVRFCKLESVEVDVYFNRPFSMVNACNLG